MGPGDLETIADARADERMELLHACLDHRFGTDLALGESGIPPTDHDIAL
ncbi:hypothetical protein [Actinomadura rudentiformis]|nr:hypothetical protein [Actinomadura rudentiformis]